VCYGEGFEMKISMRDDSYCFIAPSILAGVLGAYRIRAPRSKSVGTADHARAHTAMATNAEANTAGIADLLAIAYLASSVGWSVRVAKYVARRRCAVRLILVLLKAASIRLLFTDGSQCLMGRP
jgi:hypothetical protein